MISTLTSATKTCPLKSNPHECSSASANFGLPKLQPRGGAFLGMPTSNGFKQPYHLTGTKIAAEAEQRRKGFNLAQPSALLVGVMPLKGAILKLVVLKS